MRRLLILGVSAFGIVLVVVAGILASQAYVQGATELATPSTTPLSPEATAELRAEYLAAIDGWPYPLPIEDAMPEHPPSEFATHGGSLGGFVSQFYVCAWERAHLAGSGESRERALDMLAYWVELPPGVSFSGDAEEVWRPGILEPARAGDVAALTQNFEASCGEFREHRVDPPDGLVIDRPLPPPFVVPEDRCAGLAADVPCNPDFGPDRVVDTGPTDFAQGEAVLDSRGVPISYVVAPGDSWYAVADRFQLGPSLWSLNCYRFEWPELYVGDIVNLSKYRVATVGFNNGSTEGGAAKESCLTQTGLPPQL